MAEISDSAVFTSDTVSSGTSDLLQQAFRQVVDDDDRENEFVAYLHSNDENGNGDNCENETQTIHLTPEQAAALGLTFEVNATTDEVMYHQNQDSAVCEVRCNGLVTPKDNIHLNGQSASVTLQRLDFGHDQADAPVSSMVDLVKSECIEFGEWQVQKTCVDTINTATTASRGVNITSKGTLPSVTLNDVEFHENGDSLYSVTHAECKPLTSEVRSIPQTSQTILIEPAKTQVKNDSLSAPTQRLSTVTTSQAQILQKLPVILPSSQFIVKPAQTVLKPAKNVRVLQSTGKLVNATVSPINAVHTINANTTATSVLLSKTAILNALSPQIIKATPITAQVLGNSSLPAQLLNATQIFTGESSEMTDHSNDAARVTASIVNGTTVSTQNIVTSQIRLSPLVKSSIHRGGMRQILTPVLKSTTAACATPTTPVTVTTASVPKTTQMFTTDIPTVLPAKFLKTVQIPAQVLKSAAANGRKGSVATTIATVHSGSPIILRTTSLVKAQDLKPANGIVGTSTSVLKPTQVSSTPISILKPQTKIAISDTGKQSFVIDSQNVTSFANNLQGFIPKVFPVMTSTTNNTITQKNGISDTSISLKPMQQQNGNTISKQRCNIANGSTAVLKKRAKLTLPKHAAPTIGIGSIVTTTTTTTAAPTTTTTDLSDTTKPLGSSENPIQIVQQGQTFHSMQQLTQTQLKQIAHVLQQRSQEAANSNERVVYRVVFPEELDLRIRNPGNLLKSRGGGKRGRPKKSAIRPSLIPPKPPTVMVDEEQEEVKDERKKVVARTRSGRLSRPPRHMVRDYKHLHHLDFLQPDLDDSDGGYSDYNTNNDKLEDEESPKELLTGLEVPKRKISDHFRCPTCNKIYLGRTRMARHFEMHPDHGSPEQLPPPTPEPELKQGQQQQSGQDPLKRKGKKRGPWAYVTPEAKSERRQVKLKEAISVCEDLEIIKIAAKPVLNAQSFFELLVLKADNNVRSFLDELKQLMDKVRERAGTMLTVASHDKDYHDDEAGSKDFIDISEESLCDALGVNPGLYKINNDAFRKMDDTLSLPPPPPPSQPSLSLSSSPTLSSSTLSSSSTSSSSSSSTTTTTTSSSSSSVSTTTSSSLSSSSSSSSSSSPLSSLSSSLSSSSLSSISTVSISAADEACANEEPPLKLQKTSNSENVGSENGTKDRMCSGFSENSDLSISDLLSDRRTESITSSVNQQHPMCPEVLSALTLMRRSSNSLANGGGGVHRECSGISGNSNCVTLNGSSINVRTTHINDKSDVVNGFNTIITGSSKANNVSKLLISNPEIQNQISDNPGFQKIDITAPSREPTVSTFQQTTTYKEAFIKLPTGLSSPSSLLSCPLSSSSSSSSSTTTTSTSSSSPSPSSSLLSSSSLQLPLPSSPSSSSSSSLSSLSSSSSPSPSLSSTTAAVASSSTLSSSSPATSSVCTSQVFCTTKDTGDESKHDQIQEAFIKLEPVDEGFVKLENDSLEPYQARISASMDKMSNDLESGESGSQNFAKGFQKLVSKIIPMSGSDLNCIKVNHPAVTTLETLNACKVAAGTESMRKNANAENGVLESHETISLNQITSANCDSTLFETSDNLDMSKMHHYDHITHLEILNTSGVIDKNLLIDEKLVEQLHLVDQSNLVDELVSERLKNIMPDNILETNLIPSNSNLDTDLDFDALSEEFNRNTRS